MQFISLDIFSHIQGPLSSVSSPGTGTGFKSRNIEMDPRLRSGFPTFPTWQDSPAVKWFRDGNIFLKVPETNFELDHDVDGLLLEKKAVLLESLPGAWLHILFAGKGITQPSVVGMPTVQLHGEKETGWRKVWGRWVRNEETEWRRERINHLAGRDGMSLFSLIETPTLWSSWAWWSPDRIDQSRLVLHTQRLRRSLICAFHFLFGFFCSSQRD